jgi:hypothetical protein
MKWWAIVRLRSTKEPFALKPGEYTTIFAVGPVRIIRDLVKSDIEPHRGVVSGNFWLKTREGGEWNRGNWKWDPRWR